MYVAQHKCGVSPKFLQWVVESSSNHPKVIICNSRGGWHPRCGPVMARGSQSSIKKNIYNGGPLCGPFPIFGKHPVFGEFTLYYNFCQKSFLLTISFNYGSYFAPFSCFMFLQVYSLFYYLPQLSIDRILLKVTRLCSES